MPLVGQIITAQKQIEIFPKIGHTQFVEVVPAGVPAGQVVSLRNYNGSTWVELLLDKGAPFNAWAKLDYEAMGIEKLFNEGKITKNENEALKSSGTGLGLLLGAGLSLEFIGAFLRYGILLIGLYVIYKFAKSE